MREWRLCSSASRPFDAYALTVLRPGEWEEEKEGKEGSKEMVLREIVEKIR